MSLCQEGRALWSEEGKLEMPMKDTVFTGVLNLSIIGILGGTMLCCRRLACALQGV